MQNVTIIGKYNLAVGCFYSHGFQKYGNLPLLKEGLIRFGKLSFSKFSMDMIEKSVCISIVNYHVDVIRTHCIVCTLFFKEQAFEGKTDFISIDFLIFWQFTSQNLCLLDLLLLIKASLRTFSLAKAN